MRPTLAAEELKTNLTQYLSTTFALADPPVREALEKFLNHPATWDLPGAVPADPDTVPAGPTRDSETSWRGRRPGPFRTSTRCRRGGGCRAWTGAAADAGHDRTGSGKTEAFLVPMLDHCRRAGGGQARDEGAHALPDERAGQRSGETAHRFPHPRTSSGITAGLYTGEAPGHGVRRRLITERSEIRAQRPDILLTNYKMLDLLLLRGEDLACGRSADIAYVVLDEFHTYDGAQGTDVAMLLRRLAAPRTLAAGQAPGEGCPVATSATLGESGDEERIRDVAEQVGVAFDEDSVITERRLPPEGFLGEIDYSLPLPASQELAGLGHPRVDDQAMAEIAKLVTGQEIADPAELGRVLRTHILTHALMDVLGEKPSTANKVLDLLPRKGAYNWGEAFRRFPEQTAAALARFVALLSKPEIRTTCPGRSCISRRICGSGRSTWLLRVASPNPRFAWFGSRARRRRPRRAGWPASRCPRVLPSLRPFGMGGAVPEKDPQQLVPDPAKIYRASVSSKRLVRPLIAATDEEVTACATGQPGAVSVPCSTPPVTASARWTRTRIRAGRAHTGTR